ALALAPAAVRWRFFGGDPMQRATDRLQASSLAALSLAGVLCLVVALFFALFFAPAFFAAFCADPRRRARRPCGVRRLARGLRNCVGMAVAPNGTLWCSTNERDGLGDAVPPDYVTRVRERAFYGWPWYYIGANEDPQHRSARPDLKDKVTVPDVLIQAHSAS